MTEGHIVRTDPDPTTRTVDAISVTVAALEKQLGIRLDGLEKAHKTFEETITRVPNEVTSAIDGVKELFDEKMNVQGERFKIVDERFVSIKTRFDDLFDRLDRTTETQEKALIAALNTQKEAADKSEKSIVENIKQLGNMFQSADGERRSAIDDIKGRLGTLDARINERALGTATAVATQQASKTDDRASSNAMLTIIGIAVGAGITLFTSYLSASRAPQVVDRVVTVPSPVEPR